MGAAIRLGHILEDLGFDGGFYKSMLLAAPPSGLPNSDGSRFYLGHDALLPYQ